ncbi:MAG: hypothetical protein JWL97_3075 [Gemmatimonadales bacterium]|nr:hypothetical protein [Gemmatimonadales bacterium]
MKKLVVVLAGSAIALLTAATTRHDARDESRASQLRTEAVRLRAHFDSVDRELRGADVSRLSATQKATRAQLISWLRDYRNAGRFPQNDRFANREVPFFRDSHGTLCAMAYLVDRSGRGDIVDRIASTRNNAFIHQLTDDGALVAWLDASGLSVDEAARIQPQYGGPVIVVENNDRVGRSYAIVSLGLGSVSMGSTALNLFAPSRASSAVGLLSGAATIFAGAQHFRDHNGNKRMAQADVTVGSLAAAGALYALIFKVKPFHRTAMANPVTESAGVKWSPQLDLVGSSGRLGVGMQARF